jgi:tetratricopeptide (TPR) repeat protein
MPYYEGESLKDKVKNGPLEVAEAIDIVIQVASGLAKAHDKGIVHRDIKPANIIVTTDGQVKLVDFGVAKFAGQTTVTKTGTRVGTVGYMSPQQAVGEPLDARSDVFSLGVVLYELLAGCLPFRGDVEVALLYAIVHEDPRPLSSHRDDIPEALERVVDKALCKEPENRHADAAKLRDELETLRDEFALGRPMRMGKPRRFLRIKPRKAMVALAIATAVVLGALGLRWIWQQRVFSPGEAHALAVVDFRDLANPDDPVGFAGITGLVETGLIESSPIRVISSELLHDLRRRLFDATSGPIGAGQALQVAREANATMLLSGQMGEAGAASFVTWQLVDVRTGGSLAAGRENGDNPLLLSDQVIAKVLPVLAAQGGVEAPVAPPSVSALTTSSPDAYGHYVAGILARQQMRRPEAIHELQQAVALDSAFALALFELSRTQDEELEKAMARGYSDRAWRLRARLGIKDRMRLEAWRDRVEGHYGNAIATYRELLVRWPDNREVLADLSDVLYYIWQYGDAAEVTGKALRLYPDDVTLVDRHAASLSYTGKVEESLEVGRALTDRHPNDPNAWDELGLHYLTAGIPDSAEVAFRRALAIDTDFVWSRAGLGYCHYVRGDTDRSIIAFEELLERGGFAKSDSVELLTEVTFWPGLSLLCAEQGRYQKALGMFDKIPVSETETQLEGRIQLLLRMNCPGGAMQLVERVAESTEDQFHTLLIEHWRVRTLIALDSLPAARVAEERLRATGKEGDVQPPFPLLRAKADLALAEQNPEKAITALTEMLRQGIPPGGLHDIERREALARAYRMADRLEDAEAELRELLRIYGSHSVARYELGRIYEEMGRTEAAETEYTAFLRSWSGADPEMVQLTDARRRLDALTAGLR